MKFSVLILLFFSTNLSAHELCSSFFNSYRDWSKAVQLETQTQNGKPRYYTVRNYSHFKGRELDNYLKTIKNLTQFSEKLEEINSYIPDRTRIPSEAFFVANEIIPHIENFLKAHSVKYKIETYEIKDDLKTRRSLLIISEEGSSNLNELARDLGKSRTALTIDPIELFFGYEHYNKSRGKFFEIDIYNPAYAVSFYLLMHSVRKDFAFDISRTDLDLLKMKLETIKENMKNEGTNNIEAQLAQQRYEDSFQESRQKAAERLNKIIEQAIKKGSD